MCPYYELGSQGEQGAVYGSMAEAAAAPSTQQAVADYRRRKNNKSLGNFLVSQLGKGKKVTTSGGGASSSRSSPSSPPITPQSAGGVPVTEVPRQTSPPAATPAPKQQGFQNPQPGPSGPLINRSLSPQQFMFNLEAGPYITQQSGGVPGGFIRGESYYTQKNPVSDYAPGFIGQQMTDITFERAKSVKESVISKTPTDVVRMEEFKNSLNPKSPFTPALRAGANVYEAGVGLGEQVYSYGSNFRRSLADVGYGASFGTAFSVAKTAYPVVGKASIPIMVVGGALLAADVYINKNSLTSEYKASPYKYYEGGKIVGNVLLPTAAFGVGALGAESILNTGYVSQNIGVRYDLKYDWSLSKQQPINKFGRSGEPDYFGGGKYKIDYSTSKTEVKFATNRRVSYMSDAIGESRPGEIWGQVDNFNPAERWGKPDLQVEKGIESGINTKKLSESYKFDVNQYDTQFSPEKIGKSQGSGSSRTIFPSGIIGNTLSSGFSQSLINPSNLIDSRSLVNSNSNLNIDTNPIVNTGSNPKIDVSTDYGVDTGVNTRFDVGVDTGPGISIRDIGGNFELPKEEFYQSEIAGFPLVFPPFGGGIWKGFNFPGISGSNRRGYQPSLTGAIFNLKTPQLKRRKMFTGMEIRGI